MGSFSVWHWLIVLVIVLLIFGTKKLRNVGQDLGGAVIGFGHRGKAANAPDPAAPTQPPPKVGGQTIDVEVKEKTKS